MAKCKNAWKPVAFEVNAPVAARKGGEGWNREIEGGRPRKASWLDEMGVRFTEPWPTAVPARNCRSWDRYISHLSGCRTLKTAPRPKRATQPFGCLIASVSNSPVTCIADADILRSPVAVVNQGSVPLWLSGMERLLQGIQYEVRMHGRADLTSHSPTRNSDGSRRDQVSEVICGKHLIRLHCGQVSKDQN